MVTYEEAPAVITVTYLGTTVQIRTLSPRVPDAIRHGKAEVK